MMAEISLDAQLYDYMCIFMSQPIVKMIKTLERHDGLKSGQLSELRNRCFAYLRQPGRAVAVEW